MQLCYPAHGNADDWQIFLWNLPDDFVSRPQKLVLMLMIEARFNAFDPYRVVEDLLRHRDLWDGVVMERGFPWCLDGDPLQLHIHGDLIALRDVGRGHWNVDTVYILTTENSETAWQPVLSQWHADETSFERGENAARLLGSWGGVGRSILRVWWD